MAAELATEDYDDDAYDRMYNAKTEELKLAMPYPIATIDVPPESFYYTQNENGFTACVEVKSLPYSEALQRFGAWVDRDGHACRRRDGAEFDPRDLGLDQPS